MPDLMNEARSFQVVVAGGGPAGLAAAIALQQRGFSCAVFDGQLPPVDKACGEGLMPDALAALAELGVTLPTEMGFAIEGICFRDEARQIAADFAQGCGRGVRRVQLHALLASRAEALGVRLFWGAGAALDGGRTILVRGIPVQCEWLVIADGQMSTLAARAGFDASRTQHLRFAVRQHYRIAPWTSRVEVYWGAHKQVYVTSVGTEEVGVAVLTGERPSDFRAMLREFPELEKRLRSADVVSRMRASVTANRRRSRVGSGRVALVGDASGSVDAITGEGLAVAFRQALSLADAIAAGDLARYQRDHEQLATVPRRMANLLLALDRHPALRTRLMDACLRRPGLFHALLRVHTDGLSLAEFAVRHGGALLWNIARRPELRGSKRLDESASAAHP